MATYHDKHQGEREGPLTPTNPEEKAKGFPKEVIPRTRHRNGHRLHKIKVFLPRWVFPYKHGLKAQISPEDR